MLTPETIDINSHISCNYVSIINHYRYLLAEVTRLQLLQYSTMSLPRFYPFYPSITCSITRDIEVFGYRGDFFIGDVNVLLRYCYPELITVKANT